MNDTLPGYTVLDGPPTIPDYLTLRREAGMSRKTEEQAAAGIGCIHSPNSAPVATTSSITT